MAALEQTLHAFGHVKHSEEIVDVQIGSLDQPRHADEIPLVYMVEKREAGGVEKIGEGEELQEGV